MTRAFCSWLCVALLGCAATRDAYVGSDIHPVDASVSNDDPPEPPEPRTDATPPVRPQPEDAGPPKPPPPLVCASKTADCDGERANGCEVDLQTDPKHCGACGNACSSPDCACRDGVLRVVCPAGRANCDGDDRNGCEVDINTSMQHCGACGKLCHISGHDAIAATCTAGRCKVTCESELMPEGDCDNNPDNGCETSLWSNENCGACGVRCACASGRCL